MAASKVFSQNLIEQLQQIVGKDQVKTSEGDLRHYGKDWTTVFEAHPGAVVLPKSTSEVQALVQLANTEKFAVVPSGGRTGLSGGALACQGELVIALDRMNQITHFNDVDQSVSCQAGVVTEQIQKYAQEQGYYFPVDFASSGSSQIGGNLSTNAGGIKVLRYGMTRAWVLGVTVVTGSGEIMQLGRGLYKDNTGYDLKQLFIGAEGTLGLITEVILKCVAPPNPQKTLLLGVDQLESLMPVMVRFRQHLELSAFEFFSHNALEKVMQDQRVAHPLDTQAPYYALIEYEHTHDGLDDKALAAFEDCMTAGLVVDGVISQSDSQAQGLWALRENISESIAKFSPHKHDIAVKPSAVPEFLKAIEAYVAEHYPDFETLWFGHIGDGNVHLNILKPEALENSLFLEHCRKVTQGVFEIVRRFEGSISAEHGVGLLKKPYLAFSKSQEQIALMKAIKQVFDPLGIMNPGKIF